MARISEKHYERPRGTTAGSGSNPGSGTRNRAANRGFAVGRGLQADSNGLVLVESSAQFSLCRRYRYTLTRRFDDGPAVAFIGLNPSTADEHADDPTIRRCLGFARRWGYGQLVMLNLYALRSTDPKVLRALPSVEAEGPNLYHVARQATAARLVVCAWGADPGPDPDRPRHVLSQLRRLGVRPVALALTKHGQPRHPLYVRSDVQPVPYPKGAP